MLVSALLFLRMEAVISSTSCSQRSMSMTRPMRTSLNMAMVVFLAFSHNSRACSISAKKRIDHGYRLRLLHHRFNHWLVLDFLDLLRQVAAFVDVNPAIGNAAGARLTQMRRIFQQEPVFPEWMIDPGRFEATEIHSQFKISDFNFFKATHVMCE